MQEFNLLASNTFATDGNGGMETDLEKFWARQGWEGKIIKGGCKGGRGGGGKGKGKRQGAVEHRLVPKSQIDTFMVGGRGNMPRATARVITALKPHPFMRSDNRPLHQISTFLIPATANARKEVCESKKLPLDPPLFVESFVDRFMETVGDKDITIRELTTDIHGAIKPAEKDYKVNDNAKGDNKLDVDTDPYNTALARRACRTIILVGWKEKWLAES